MQWKNARTSASWYPITGAAMPMQLPDGPGPVGVSHDVGMHPSPAAEQAATWAVTVLGSVAPKPPRRTVKFAARMRAYSTGKELALTMGSTHDDMMNWFGAHAAAGVNATTTSSGVDNRPMRVDIAVTIIIIKLKSTKVWPPSDSH